MPKYLFQAAYSDEAWAAQTSNPQNRFAKVRGPVENLGGSIEAVYYAFGEYDVVAIIDFPDNVSASAWAIAARSGGALAGGKTTPLMTPEEGVEAMRKAGDAGYKPPGA